MRMKEISAGVGRRESVAAGAARLDRRLREVSDAILIDRQSDAVPMDACVLVRPGQMILERRFEAVAEVKTDDRRPGTLGEGPHRQRAIAEAWQRGRSLRR